MPPVFVPIRGAQGFQQSNPSVLAAAALLGSLQVFEAVGGIQILREHSLSLTGFLDSLLKQSKYFVPIERTAEASSEPRFTIITPNERGSRGAQLSLLFLPENSGIMQKVLSYLKASGVIGDERNPNVIRLAPVPLYNTKEDCIKAVEVLNRAFELL